jgi:transcriptional regulator with XRE-family HTH domain
LRYNVYMTRRQDDTGTRLMLLRRGTGKNQGELADALLRRGVKRVTGSHISNIELNKKKPSLEVAIALADELGTSLDYLTGRTDVPEMMNEHAESVIYLSEQADEIARIVDNLPPYRRDELLAHARMVEVMERDNERDVQAALDAVAPQLRAAGSVIGPDAMESLKRLLLDYTATLLGVNATASVATVTNERETAGRRKAKA